MYGGCHEKVRQLAGFDKYSTIDSALPWLQFERTHLHYHKSMSNARMELYASIAYYACAVNIAIELL